MIDLNIKIISFHLHFDRNEMLNIFELKDLFLTF